MSRPLTPPSEPSPPARDTSTAFTSHDAALEALRQQQAALKAQLAQLDVQVSHALSRRNQATAISRLPDEVLENIFYHAAAPRAGSWAPQTIMAVKLSHVSMRWRYVALRARGLWTNIFYSFYRSHDSRRVDTQAERNAVWLERSGAQPLYIMVLTAVNHGTTTQFTNMLNTVMSNLHRCKSLRVACHAESDLLTIASTCRHVNKVLPLLTELELWTSDGLLNASVISMDAPNLRIVRLGIVPPVELEVPSEEHVVPDVYRNLTEIRLRGCHGAAWNHMVGFLQASPDLQRLKLDYLGFPIFPMDHADQLQVELRSLDNMRLGNLDAAQCEQFMRLIRTPNLRRLKVKLGERDRAPATSITSTIANAPFAATLTHLRLSHVFMAPGACVLMLAELPSLTLLGLSEANVSSEMFDMLRVFETSRTGRSTMLLPALDTLDLSHSTSPVRSRYMSGAASATSPSIFQSLLDYVLARKAALPERAKPIRQLRLFDGQIPGATRAAIADAVPRVVNRWHLETDESEDDIGDSADELTDTEDEDHHLTLARFSSLRTYQSPPYYPPYSPADMVDYDTDTVSDDGYWG